MTQPNDLLTVREAATYLNSSEVTVQRLVRKGLLRAVQRSPRLQFHHQDLDHYLALQQHLPQSRAGNARLRSVPFPAPSSDGELLYAIAVATTGEHRLERILSATLEQLGYAINFTGGSIALVEGDDLVIRAAVGPFAHTAVGLRQPRGRGIGWQVVSTGKPFLSHDLLAEGRRLTGTFRSYLAVPLTWRGSTIGMLELDSIVAHAFTDDDLRLLRRVALALSGAIELARRYTAEVTALAAAEQAQQRLRLLAEASAAFTTAGLNFSAVLDIITQRTAEVIGDACSILLLTDDDQRLDLTAVYHPDPDTCARIQTLLAAVPYHVGTGALSTVVRSGQPLLVPTLSPEQMRAITNPAYWPYLDNFPIASLLVVPMRVQGRTLGVLTMSRDRPGRPYSPEDQQLLQDLADRAALAIANAQLYATVIEQREWFRATLASIGDAVIVTDDAGEVRFINPVAEALTGWAANEAIGQPLNDVFQIVNATTRDTVESPVEHVLREGVIVGLANHTVLLAQDGREVPIDDSGAPIRDSEGRLSGVVLVFRDITARYEAERELRQSRDQLAVILRGITDGITVQDRSGMLIYANDAAAQLSGFATGEEMVATPPREILQHFALLDADANPLPLELLPGRQALQGQVSPPRELRFRVRSSGQERWSLVTATPVRGPDGGVELVVNIFRDITARKRAEHAQRFLSEASAALATSLDEETTLHTVAGLVVPALADWCVVDLLRETGALETVAVAHADPAKVQLGWEVIRRYPLDPDAPHGTAHVLRTGQSEFVPNIPDDILDAIAQDADHPRLLRALGFRASMCVPLLAGGRAIGALAFVADQPGRFDPDDLALAQELARRIGVALENARLYTTAQKAIAVRDQFLSVASHELKTPLTSMLGYVGLIKRRLSKAGVLSERDLRALQVIEAQGERLDALILSLLDLSRLQAGQLHIELVPMDVRALAHRVVEEMIPTLEHHTLSLYLPDEPIVIQGDELRLEQVVQNLLRNAVKYSPAGGPIIVTLSVEGTAARLSVRDTGIGIPEASLPHLFSRFYRAANADSAKISGFGLGLYVVREIMLLHGGTIEVESQEGQGSTFTLCFSYDPGKLALPGEHTPLSPGDA